MIEQVQFLVLFLFFVSSLHASQQSLRNSQSPESSHAKVNLDTLDRNMRDIVRKAINNKRYPDFSGQYPLVSKIGDALDQPNQDISVQYNNKPTYMSGLDLGLLVKRIYDTHLQTYLSQLKSCLEQNKIETLDEEKERAEFFPSLKAYIDMYTELVEKTGKTQIQTRTREKPGSGDWSRWDRQRKEKDPNFIIGQ